jgi:hypothetical protein
MGYTGVCVVCEQVSLLGPPIFSFEIQVNMYVGSTATENTIHLVMILASALQVTFADINRHPLVFGIPFCVNVITVLICVKYCG